jgi:hypothetical protein
MTEVKKRKTLTSAERRDIAIANMAADKIKRGAGGRPTDYNEELALEICEAISKCTLSIPKLVKENPHWPLRDTIAIWRVRYPKFYDMYMKAKQAQCDLYAEECVEISDSDILEATQRDTLRVNTRKWFVSKLAPKIYGDKMTIEDKDGRQSIISAAKEKVERALGKRKRDIFNG